jgi:transcriptional regulator with XRE-family HTH domain
MEKFNESTLVAKKLIKQRRRSEGYSMDAFSEKIGLSRKKLEDIEAVRDYGCFIDIEMLLKIAKALDCEPQFFFNDSNIRENR